MGKSTRIIILTLLLPLVGAASLRPFSEYPDMSAEEKYEDLKLRLLFDDFSSFGSYNKRIENISGEIEALLENLEEGKKKILNLVLVLILIDQGKYDEANKNLEIFANEKEDFLRSRYFYLKGKIPQLKFDFDRAFDLYTKGLEHAKGIGKYSILLRLGILESQRGNNEKAIKIMKENLSILDGKYRRGEARLAMELGKSYLQSGEYALSLDNLFKALDYYKEIGDNSKTIDSLNLIAIVKEALGKYDEQISYYKQAESYFTPDVQPVIKLFILGNLFYAYFSKKKDFINAEKSYEKAFSIAKKHNLKDRIIYLKTVSAFLNVEKDNPEHAIEILESIKNIQDKYWTTFAKHRFSEAYSRAYWKMNKLKLSEDYFLKAELFLDKLGRSDIEILHSKNGVDIYKKMGKIDKEYEYYRRWQELKEKIDREQSKKLLYARENESLALNNQLYAQENKNLALKNQQAELILENQKTRLFALSGFVVAILIIVALQFNRNKIIKRKNIALETKERIIREKTNDLQAILDNIVQGVVTIELIDERTRLLKNTSQHFFKIFTNLNASDFEDSDPIKVLFEGTSLSAEDLSKINSLIISSTGESFWQWEINQDNLPMEMTILNGTKIIEIDWVAVLDQDKISKLIITFKDVTEIRGLGEKQKQNEINVQKLVSLSLMDQKEYFILMSSVGTLIKESIEVINDNKEFSKEIIDLVFRNLHTIKGLARTYDLMLLSAYAHQIEDYFQEIRANKVDYDQSVGLEKLHKLATEIETYQNLAKTKLKWDQEVSTVPLSVKVLTKWYQSISEVNEGHKLDVLLKEIKNKYSTSLKDALQNIIMNSQKLSKELNKGEVLFTLKGCDIFVTEKMQGHLSSIFVHLIRNSIDHGFIESSERDKQKMAPPEIKINVENGPDHHVIFFSDNGKGLNLCSLRLKAKENKIEIDTNDEIEVASLIFHSGISTKEEISNISGRGVGMDAVRKYLEGLGGNIELIANGESNEDYLPVTFKITVPLVFFEV